RRHWAWCTEFGSEGNTIGWMNLPEGRELLTEPRQSSDLRRISSLAPAATIDTPARSRRPSRLLEARSAATDTASLVGSLVRSPRSSLRPAAHEPRRADDSASASRETRSHGHEWPSVD